MGESTVAMMETVKDVLLVDKIVNKLQGLRAMIPDFVWDFYREYRLLCYFVAIAGLVLLAFEGYKLFKMGLYVAAGTGAAVAGYMLLSPIVCEYTKDLIPDMVNTKILTALACALVAIFLTRFAYNFMVLLIGAGCGFLFGYSYVWRVLVNYFKTLEFLTNNYVRLAIGGVFAAIAGLVFILLFKHMFMVGSGLACMTFAAILLRKILVPTADDNLKLCFVIAGAVIGVLAIVHQYKEEEKSLEIFF